MGGEEVREALRAVEQRPPPGDARLLRDPLRSAREEHPGLLEELPHRAGDERRGLGRRAADRHLPVLRVEPPAGERVEPAREAPVGAAAHEEHDPAAGLVAVEDDGGREDRVHQILTSSRWISENTRGPSGARKTSISLRTPSPSSGR